MAQAHADQGVEGAGASEFITPNWAMPPAPPPPAPDVARAQRFIGNTRAGQPSSNTSAEDRAAAEARSGVFSAAIRARLDAGNTESAFELLERTAGQLDPAQKQLLVRLRENGSPLQLRSRE